MADGSEEWTWDPKKADENRKTHGVGFAEAIIALSDPLALTRPDDEKDESRMITMGMDARGRVLVVVWTHRGNAGRVISARRATPRERRAYEETP